MSIQIEKSHSNSKREKLVGSRLTPFEKLPRIGSSNEYIPHPPQSHRHHSISNPRKIKETILIAIKLNDGRRLQKEFSSNNTINDIIIYIKSQMIDPIDQFYLSSGDVPKRQFKDLNLTLLQANIKTRSMEIEKEFSGHFYRQLLNSAKVFLTEVDDSRSSTTIEQNSSQSDLAIETNINKELKSTRQQCHQRLLNCSRKKLRLLSLQEQNDKRHYGFQKFIDNLDQKRSENIRRYQIELKNYLLKRLEADRLKQQLHLLNLKIDQLNEEKKRYSHILNIVQKSIPLFPPGLLQGNSDGIKSLILRYETLVQTKSYFEQRDFSNEKQQRKLNLQKLIVQHNTTIAQLNTRIAHLHSKINSLQKNQLIKEDIFLNQLDLNRSNITIQSQIQSSINSLYDRYRLHHQIQSNQQLTTIQKLKNIQEFILYRIDLLQRAKQ